MAAPPPEEWTSLAKLNAEFEELIIPLKGRKMITSTTTIEDIRKLADQAPIPLWPEVLEQDVQIPMKDGVTNRARIYSPSQESGKAKPLLVMVHGGGYCIGKLENEEIACRKWTKRFGGIAVSIEHRKGPEYPFPQAHHDIYTAVKWAASNAPSIGADPTSGFVLAGISSGASSMAAISHLWRDEHRSPPLTGLYLSIPAPCVVSALPEEYKHLEHAWEQNKDAPLFDVETSDFLAKHYKPDPESPLRSALLFPTGHEGLPPTYFVIAGADPWRDVGLIYEKVLRENGVKTKVDVFPGLPHGFWGGMFKNANFSKDYEVKRDEGFRWLVEG